MRSIRLILFLAFMVVILVAVGTVATFTLRNAAMEIAEYDNLADELEMTRITHWLTGYFDIHESWDQVHPYLDEIGVMYGRRVVLTDTEGRVVADTRTDGTLLFGGAQWRTRSLQFDRFDDPVGTVHVHHDFTIVDSFRGRLAASIRRFLFLSSGLAVALALLVSFAVSRPLVTPISVLATVSDRVAGGDLDVRVTVPRVREFRSLATAFNRMVTDLQAAEALRKNMIADVAHELRTPLSNVRGYLEAMRDGVVAPSEAVDVVEREMLMLTRLADDLQELSVTEAGEVVLVREQTDLREVVRQVSERFVAGAADRSVEIRVSVPNHPIISLVDPVRLSQMLGNLISNAITHSPPDGHVVISVAQNGGHLQITVADTGAGIPPAHLPFVFERFYRVDRSRSRSTGGHGLGLTIARSIAIAHGGTLAVESTEGEGSCFTVTLPAPPHP
jgi:signal transduction histidine kinase